MSEDHQLDLFNDVRDKDISSIDRLFRDVKRFRKSSEFKQKLDFYCGFPYLGVYNAALVEQQRPGARLVLTTEKWRELYNRKIKINARPVIILMPFYPVDFLFDIADTKPIDNSTMADDDEVIDGIIHRYRAKSTQEVGFYYDNMMKNLPKQGIYYTNEYITGSELQAEIRQDSSEKVYVQINKDYGEEHHNYFTLSVSMRANLAGQLASMFHELGHLFCQHLPCSWWEGRSYTKEIKEFEAEIVSYLVCQRLGIETQSVEYLSNYMEENELIPPILIDFVFQAVDIIEQMARGNLDVTKCLLYKKDKQFKAKVDVIKEKIKEEREKKKAIKQSL